MNRFVAGDRVKPSAKYLQMYSFKNGAPSGGVIIKQSKRYSNVCVVKWSNRQMKQSIHCDFLELELAS